MSIGRQIDHIVYAVPDLKAACQDLEEKLGQAPLFGGYHPRYGTKNAVLNLGDECYLEILAVDEKNPNVSAPRWMGVDLIDKPHVTRWALKSDDLAADGEVLRGYDSQMGKVQGGQRLTADGKLFAWEMQVPLAEPAVEIMPFMIDWQLSASHPCDALEEKCKLIGIHLGHPDPGQMEDKLKELGIHIRVEASESPFIQIEIDSPNGRVKLG
jgi:hypothetical protein